ncbi:MAG: LysR family transcriptional regulator [Myxococcota bacterium]
MDLTQLRYFQAIAQRGSISAAARHLRVSQPSLTVAVQNLEETLKTTLLLRDRRGVTLTESGKILLTAATEVFERLTEVEARILGLETEEVGRFVLGCHESLGAYFLPAMMAELLAKAPRIELSLWNGPSAEVRDGVIARELHFGLVVNPSPHPELVLVELFEDAVDVFVSAKEPAPADLAAARERLLSGPLIYAGRVSEMQALMEHLERADMLPEKLLAVGDLELVKSLALAGVGVALLPRRVAAYGHEGALRRLHPELPFVQDRIQLLYRADLHKTRAAVRLKDALVAHGKSLAIGKG